MAIIKRDSIEHYVEGLDQCIAMETRHGRKLVLSGVVRGSGVVEVGEGDDGKYYQFFNPWCDPRPGEKPTITKITQEQYNRAREYFEKRYGRFW